MTRQLPPSPGSDSPPTGSGEQIQQELLGLTQELAAAARERVVGLASPYRFLQDDARADLEHHLGVELEAMCMPILRVEFQVAERLGPLQGRTAPERAAAFAASLGGRAGLMRLLERYPPAAHFVRRVADEWVELARSLALALEEDLVELSKDESPVRRIRPRARLAFGIGPVGISFANDLDAVFYAGRIDRVRAWYRLLRWLNAAVRGLRRALQPGQTGTAASGCGPSRGESWSSRARRATPDAKQVWWRRRPTSISV